MWLLLTGYYRISCNVECTGNEIKCLSNIKLRYHERMSMIIIELGFFFNQHFVSKLL